MKGKRVSLLLVRDWHSFFFFSCYFFLFLFLFFSLSLSFLSPLSLLYQMKRSNKYYPLLTPNFSACPLNFQPGFFTFHLIFLCTIMYIRFTHVSVAKGYPKTLLYQLGGAISTHQNPLALSLTLAESNLSLCLPSSSESPLFSIL